MILVFPFGNLDKRLTVMIYYIFIVAFIFFQDAIPLKPDEEFELKLNYQFKTRPPSGTNTVYLSNQSASRSASSGVLPYLVLEIKMLLLPGEKSKVSISNNLDNRSTAKKVTLNSVLELDLGFTDDMIDRVKPHQYTITFIDAKREPVNRIVISVDEDGSFFVNGEKRGKF